MRKAKIVCTLGPASDAPAAVRELVRAGMDIARLNMSHGSHDDHARVCVEVRRASEEVGRAVGVLADLQGPKIRTGRFENGAVFLKEGERFTITTREVAGSETEVGTTYAGLPGDVHVGDRILVDDGKLGLIAVEVSETDVVCQVIEGGWLSNNKGINVPGAALSVPALSEKDRDDLRWALRQGVDMVALSFVRTAADIRDVHQIMDQIGLRVPVIAKIEKPQAVENLDEVIRAFDGVMVARGDLGVEMPLDEVPLVQKRACEIARRRAKPVIVATQVLESMVESSRPTRAEASDAANAVLDGADALMLSGETSVGKFPFEAVRTMARIITTTETHGMHRIRPLDTRPNSKGGAVTAAAADIGELLGCKYLVTFTQSGDSARRLSRVRPRIPMLAFTPLQSTRSQLALSWGVETYLVPPAKHTDSYAMQVDTYLLREHRVEEGDLVVIVAGSPPGIPGSTNALRVHRIGDAKNRVAPAYTDVEGEP